ncbi:SusC/RagA family TonB-linked outer membrane protein [Chitinophaga sp. SYP-B3965]|uniref:TonB-dependent receptor n=1 Tax=Chitinophaga sp. SYP-B3965 TaxID=2663120 RepID=UPI001299EA87|nr:TonB-dependent receptor [Chitinophaga sp. SYP-B3965]MRG48268.1 SusC/RagA family TonB-linked outer membrane protein [Chitinophaga sp. SYP-B3965]
MRKCMRDCRQATRRALRTLALSCIFFSLFHATEAQVKSLQSPVTVSGNNMSLLQVFRAIKKQTGFTLVYNNQLLDDGEKLNMNFRNTALQEVLDFVLKNKGIIYQLRSNRIVLDRKAPETTPAKPNIAQDEKKTQTVKGQVMDPEGNPIPGATVSVNGTVRGVITDALGVFTIDAAPNEVLRVAMLGMKPEELKMTGQKTLKVTLTAKVDDLNELVVVGFGKQKKVTVTGSVSSVNMADMQTPVRSLTNALAGKVAGVISMQNAGGEPGYDNPQFTIRGIGTFTGSTSPLIIVDGVQREDVNSTYGGAFNNIDPEDVQSISLLKDASATAVYGAKGANGVLIITTKRGVAGKPRIAAKVETGFNGLTRMPEMLDGVTYMKLYNEARENAGETPIYSDEQIAKTASGLDPYLYPNVNWIDRIYKDWASMTNANVNVSGGGESMRYYVSMSFYNQDGQYKVSKINDYNPNLNFKRYDFRSNVDLNVTKTTTLSLNLAAMLVNSRYPGSPASLIWYNSYSTNPIAFPVQYPDNMWAGPRNNGGANPFNLVQNRGYSTEFKPSVQSVLSLVQNLDGITKGLKATGRFSFDTYGEFNTSRTGDNDLWYAGSRGSDGKLIYEQVRTGSSFLGYGSSSRGERVMYLEGNVTYDRTFGKHNFGALIVGTMRNRLIGNADGLKLAIPFRNQSAAARVTYGYMDKYLAEVNMGATGSENFEKGKRWGVFPAVAAGWVISNENFMEGISNTLTLLKLRASIGTTGNDALAYNNRFGYLTYVDGANGIQFGSSPRSYGGIAANVIGTENLTWETSVKTNIGLDVSLWNKLNINFDVFKDERKDILIQRNSISSIGGYGSNVIFANMGEMQNKGFDASLEYTDQISKDISLRVFGNITYAKNKILFADNPVMLYAYQQREGHPDREYYGYKDLGLFIDQNDVDKSPKQLRPVFPGDIKYEDLNGDGEINSNDQSYLGKNSFPTWSYGFGLNLGVKKFELSVIFAGIEDVWIMANGSETNLFDGTAPGVGVVPFTGIGQYPANIINNVTDRWTKDNPRQDAYYPRLTITNSSDNNYQNSTRWLKDGSFMRLKQATLSYNIITPAMQKKGISSLQVYVAGTNLLTISKFKIWDPELGSNGAKYPFAKTATVGLRANF